jgi:hypothetical protein
MLEARRNAVQYLGDAGCCYGGSFLIGPQIRVECLRSGKCDCAEVVAGKVHCWPWMGKVGFPLEDQGALLGADRQGDHWSSSYFLSSEL